MLIQYLLMIAGIFLLEAILHWFFDRFQADQPGDALKLYQNSYFSLNPHFIVAQDLGNEYSGESSASVRFLFSLLIGIPIYGIILLTVRSIKRFTKHENRILNSCFYSIMLLCLLTSFFVPKKKTTFNKEEKQLSITSRRAFLFPQTITVPYDSIQEIRYEYSTRYSFYDRAYNLYLKFYIDYQGKKLVLGDRYLGYNTKRSIDKDFIPIEEMEKEATHAVFVMEQLMKLK